MQIKANISVEDVKTIIKDHLKAKGCTIESDIEFTIGEVYEDRPCGGHTSVFTGVSVEISMQQKDTCDHDYQPFPTGNTYLSLCSKCSHEQNTDEN